jgi:hypothetical protein
MLLVCLIAAVFVAIVEVIAERERRRKEKQCAKKPPHCVSHCASAYNVK